MRRIVAAISIVLMGISTPVLAQSSVSGAPAAPYGSTAVNYDNGMQALGQARNDDDHDNKGGLLLFGSPAGTVATVLLGAAAIGGIAYAISQSNKNNPVSP